MKIETIARLFELAASRVRGDLGNIAVYHLGTAMKEFVLAKYDEERNSLVDFHVEEAKRCIRSAKTIRGINPVKKS